jgi:hypothetical protein
MKKLLACLLIFLSACVSSLRPDSSVPAIQANYPTAEFVFDHKIYHGLGIVSVLQGSDLSQLDLEVQTFSSGAIKIDSRDCGLSVSQDYKDFEKVRVPLSGAAIKNCLVTVTVTPRYAPQSNSPIEVFGLIGNFAIRVIRPGETWIGSAHKVTGNFSKELVYNVGGSGRVRAVFSGCGVNFDEVLDLDQNGLLHLDLARLVDVPRGTCVLEGVVISPVFQDLLINEIVSKYDPAFTPLPIPAITISGARLKIDADNTVSLIGVDDAYKYASSVTVRNFDSSHRTVIHALTVRGRSVVCVWEGKWSCQQ